MTNSADHPDVAAVKAVFEEIVAKYSCASMEVEIEHPCGGSMLSLKCSAPGTSHVSACVLMREIDLYVGVNTCFDFVWRKSPKPDVMDTVRAIIESIAEGRLEETVWEWLGDPAGGEPGCDLPCLVEEARAHVVVPAGRRFHDWLRRAGRRFRGHPGTGEP